MSSEKAISRVLTLSSVSDAEGVAHHGGARDLAEGADMRQAGGAVAGLENDFVLGIFLQPRHDLARLLERPGARLLGDGAQGRGGFSDGHRILQRAGHYESGAAASNIVKTG